MKNILISFLLLSAVILIGRPILGFMLPTAGNQHVQKFVGQYHIDYDKQLTIPQSYVDVNNLHPLKNEVTSLTAFGLVLGDKDGQLRSSKEMTHGEAYDLFNQIKRITKKDLTFTFLKNDDVLLTHEQLAQLLVTTFELQPVKNDITFKDEHKIQEKYVQAMKILAHHGISTGYLNKIFPNEEVNRATTIALIYRAAIATNHIAPINYTIEEKTIAPNLIKEFANIYSLPFDRNVYIRSDNPLTYLGHTKTTYETASDDSHNYSFDDLDATLTVTTRTFKNDDQFIFLTLHNHSTKAVSVELIERHPSNVTSTLYRYDRYPLQRIGLEVFGEDTSTYPVGVQQLMSYDTLIQEKMIGQAYRSQQLSQLYGETGGTSVVRDLQLEYDPLSTVHLSTAFLNFITINSNGNDIVDTWYMMSKEHLFNSNESMEAWMEETAENFIKRNKWYTANGVYSKMATSIEPLPKSKQAFGRNLLMQKEDRALVLYNAQGDRYFENLISNAFVNLQQFKGQNDYWETEVTSTYLKDLYGITAPFIDTRFNEQIALFYLKAGKQFGVTNYKQPLQHYAGLLVSRKKANQTIHVTNDAYYIADYFPLKQNIVTHSSMNHILGGLNVLLLAYEQFGNEKYLQVANAIYKAIEYEQHLWIRNNGDIWYRISPQGEFKGDDYKHLTLEDLLKTYKLYTNIDKNKLPLFEKLIATKSQYMSDNNIGYTDKIFNGLKELDMLHYLPKGELFTDTH